MKKGIDVSYANRSIDWAKASEKIDFAILRSTFGSDLPSQTDYQFHYNALQCKKNNIPFGTYHFAYFVDEKKALDEANFAIRMADLYKESVRFIALDIEEDSEAYAKRLGKNPNWTQCALTFLNRIEEAGYTPVLYSNQNWLINKLDYNLLKKYKLWYAAPMAEKPKYDCAIWQYSWEGKIDGIIGDVDMDYLYDESILSQNLNNVKVNNQKVKKDRDIFLEKARTYIGKTGDYVCNTKLKLGAIYNWCAFAVSSIMQDCGFIGKYINAIQGGAGDIPRYSDGKYGTWFAKGTKTPQAGDLIFFRYAGAVPTDKYFSSHVGIVEEVDNNVITTLEGNVEGQNSNWAVTSNFKRKFRYLNNSDVYAFYRPNWKDNENNKKEPIDVFYKVYINDTKRGSRWLPEVKNTEDFAGLEEKKIQGIYAKLSKGDIVYRVRCAKGWLPWVKNYEDYAGILGYNIDAIQMKLEGLEDYDVEYRVSLIGSTTYLPWVTNYQDIDTNGYAGIVGCAIDKVQIRIVKREE